MSIRDTLTELAGKHPEDPHLPGAVNRILAYLDAPEPTSAPPEPVSTAIGHDADSGQPVIGAPLGEE